MDAVYARGVRDCPAIAWRVPINLDYAWLPTYKVPRRITRNYTIDRITLIIVLQDNRENWFQLWLIQREKND